MLDLIIVLFLFIFFERSLHFKGYFVLLQILGLVRQGTLMTASVSRAPRVRLSRSTAYISHPSGSLGFLSLSTVLHSRNSGHLGSVRAAGSDPACWLVAAGNRKAVLVSHVFDSSVPQASEGGICS